ncbi:hypothetical protein [Stenotrophomonas rhizophila]|uniref:Uncharacterized protein n=1 Tax=Stenotrophomonas rhizophila TaxID=216778 RepID=A0AAW5PFG1_9GAMM|nr:hypothetical protein [Stenotrophomonas rhizophila]MCS4279214.1 hypothetical protein [Stenotrophomonas rhizophila]
MKLQFQHQSLRIRLDEAELAQLLSGGSVVNRTVFGPGQAWSQQIRLERTSAARLAGDVQHLDILLPYEAVTAYSLRLPCREGIVFMLDTDGDTLQLQFDVDVRDSVRQRGPARREAGSVAPD